jgi:hypothetical protein
MEKASKKQQKKSRNRGRKRIPQPIDYNLLMSQRTIKEREQFSKEERDRYDVDGSEGIKRAEATRIKAKNALEKEIEVFVSNIPFNNSPRDLVEFILGCFINYGNELVIKTAVVRCEFFANKKTLHGGHSGCAVVLFKNEQLSSHFMTSSLTFHGRQLRVKLGNNFSKGRRRIQSDTTSFIADRLQLSLGLPEAAMTVANLPSVIEWQTTMKDESQISMDIDSAKRAIVLHFDCTTAGINDSYNVEISMRRISRVIVGRLVDSSDMIVAFHLLYPPRLYRKERPHSNFDLEGMFDDYEGMFGLSLASGIKKSYLWELDFMEKDDVWLRTVGKRGTRLRLRLELDFTVRFRVDGLG